MNKPNIRKDYHSLVIHPYKIGMYLLLAGLTMMFLGLTFSYLYARVQTTVPAIKIPWLFWLNTIILIGSSMTMKRAIKHYEEDDTKGYKNMLFYTIILSIAFMLSQVIAWSLLLQVNVNITSTNAASYIYLISGLHLFHVLAGIPFLIGFLWIAVKKMKSPVTVLIYFSDPDKKLNLNLLTLYWHFLDILWIYLVVFFSLVYLFFS
jgi:cytochrome c oxidase subunit III